MTIIPANPGYFVLAPYFDHDAGEATQYHRYAVVGWRYDEEEDIVLPLTVDNDINGQVDKGVDYGILQPDGSVFLAEHYPYESVDEWFTECKQRIEARRARRKRERESEAEAGVDASP